MQTKVSTFDIKGLECQIPPSINECVRAAHLHHIQWACQLQIVRENSSNYRRLQKAKFAWLIGRTYSYVSLEDLNLAVDLATWLFAYDDICDASQIKNNPGGLMTLHQRFLDILQGNEMVSEDDPLCRALHDIYQRLYKRTSRVWVKTFVEQIKDYLEANRWEASNRLESSIPDLGTYIKMRQFSGAVNLCFSLIGIFCDIDPRAEFLRHSYLKQLSVMANNRICWDNDIFGLQKEIQEGNINNLVLVLQHEYKIDLQEAVDLAVQMSNKELDAFFKLEKRFREGELGYFVQEETQFQKYLNGICCWIGGNFDWYSDTERYQVS